MTLQNKKKLAFTLPVVFMFAVFLSAVVACPPPLSHEVPFLVLLGWVSSLLPGFLMLGMVSASYILEE